MIIAATIGMGLAMVIATFHAIQREKQAEYLQALTEPESGPFSHTD